MKLSRKTVLITCLVVATCLVMLLAFGIIQDYRQRRQAEALLGVFREVRVGITDRATAERLITPFQRYIVSGVGGEVTFGFRNRWLFLLKTAPLVAFYASFAVKDGVVVEKSAYIVVSSTRSVAEVTERTRGFRLPEGFPAPPNHTVISVPNASLNGVWRIHIVNDDTYGEMERQKDWEFDLSCMTRIGPGCDDARAMLPHAVVPSNNSYPSR